MALVPCWECTQPISDRAAACPRCGAPTYSPGRDVLEFFGLANASLAILSSEELVAITGYKRPSDQLPELRKQGFYRARPHPATGKIILERAHYLMVCGADAAQLAKLYGISEPRVRESAVLPPRGLRRKSE